MRKHWKTGKTRFPFVTIRLFPLARQTGIGRPRVISYCADVTVNEKFRREQRNDRFIE